MSNNEQIKTIQQTFMEVAHAQHNGSAWYTKGDSGLYQQVSMWLGRGQAALDDLEKQLAERDAALARCVEELEAAALFCSERGHDKAANHLYKMVASLPTSAQATAKVQQWQPIETAPKDGTNILLVNRAGNVATGLWQGNGEYEGWWLRGGNRPNTFFNHHYGPSYWMPLPEPPTEAIREEKGGGDEHSTHEHKEPPP